MHNKIYAIPLEIMQGTGEEVTKWEFHTFVPKSNSFGFDSFYQHVETYRYIKMLFYWLIVNLMSNYCPFGFVS